MTYYFPSEQQAAAASDRMNRRGINASWAYRDSRGNWCVTILR